MRKKRALVRSSEDQAEIIQQRRKLREALKLDHPDMMIRGVVAKAANGRWMTFDTLLQAKTILSPDHHLSIYQNKEDFDTRCPQYDKEALRTKLECKNEELFHFLRETAYNPYRAHGYEIDRELNIDGRVHNGVKRVKRNIVYKFAVPVKTDIMKRSIVKLPPQAQIVVQIIEMACTLRSAPEFKEDELKDFIVKNGFMLNTKQDPWRIFQYYRSNLINISFMRLSR